MSQLTSENATHSDIFSISPVKKADVFNSSALQREITNSLMKKGVTQLSTEQKEGLIVCPPMTEQFEMSTQSCESLQQHIEVKLNVLLHQQKALKSKKLSDTIYEGQLSHEELYKRMHHTHA